MTPEVEALVVTIRREHPGWGQRTILHQFGQEGICPLPTLSSIYRCVVRQRLITPQARERKRDDYRRRERSRAMQLWQMDIVGGVKIADGSEAKIVSGVDDPTPGSASRRMSWSGRQRARRVTRSGWRCAVTVCQRRS